EKNRLILFKGNGPRHLDRAPRTAALHDRNRQTEGLSENPELHPERLVHRIVHQDRLTRLDGRLRDSVDPAETFRQSTREADRRAELESDPRLVLQAKEGAPRG